MACQPRRMNKKPMSPGLKDLFRGRRKSWADWFSWGVSFNWSFRREPLIKKAKRMEE